MATLTIEINGKSHKVIEYLHHSYKKDGRKLGRLDVEVKPVDNNDYAITIGLTYSQGKKNKDKVVTVLSAFTDKVNGKYYIEPPFNMEIVKMPRKPLGFSEELTEKDWQYFLPIVKDVATRLIEKYTGVLVND